MPPTTKASSMPRSNLTKKRSSRHTNCSSASPVRRPESRSQDVSASTKHVIDAARENLDISAQEAENYLKKLQTETKIATDSRIALEEEREAVAMKYAGLEVEAVKKEKARQKEFESELAQRHRRIRPPVKSVHENARRQSPKKQTRKRTA